MQDGLNVDSVRICVGSFSGLGFLQHQFLKKSRGQANVAAGTIVFFSSDARDLYKADIYRALALPKGYALQFRYQRKYIHPELVTDLEGLKGQPGQIVFVTGNDLNTPEDQRSVAYHPIRDIIIREIYNDRNTESIHFFLEMGEFSDSSQHAQTPPDFLPPKSFVSRITLQDSPKKSWINRVKAIESYFKKPLFFNVVGVTRNGREIKPEFSTSDRSSHFKLKDEAEYQIEISFYDPKAGEAGLAAENSSDEVELTYPLSTGSEQRGIRKRTNFTRTPYRRGGWSPIRLCRNAMAPRIMTSSYNGTSRGARGSRGYSVAFLRWRP